MVVPTVLHSLLCFQMVLHRLLAPPPSLHLTSSTCRGGGILVRIVFYVKEEAKGIPLHVQVTSTCALKHITYGVQTRIERSSDLKGAQ